MKRVIFIFVLIAVLASLLTLTACESSEERFWREVAQSSEPSPLEVIVSGIVSTFEPMLGDFALIVPLLCLILICIILYFAAIRPYKGFLLDRYGLKLFGAPAYMTMAFYFLVMVMPLFLAGGDLLSGLDGFGYIAMILLIGLPGIAWLGILTFIRTRNVFFTILNVLIMYPLCLFVSYIAVGLVGLIIIVKAMRGATRDLGATKGVKCPSCGDFVVSGSGGSCGCGRVRL